MVNVLAICIESPDNPYGGMGVHVRCLYKNSDNVTLLTLSGDYVNDKKYNIISPIRNGSTIFNNLDPVSTWMYNKRCMVNEGLAYCFKNKIDVIHAHDWASADVGLDIKEVLNIPMVTTFHLFQTQILDVEQLEMDKKMEYCLYKEAEALNRSEKLIMCSKFMIEYATKRMLIDEEKIVLIPNAVEFNDKPNLIKNNNRPIVMYSGRFSKQKGIELCFEVAKKCKEYDFLFMGRLPTRNDVYVKNHPYTKMINKLTKKYPNRIKHIDWCDGTTKQSMYQKADVGLMPSLAEPYGLVALDFMASGVPLVTTRVDGMTDFCNDKNSVKVDYSVSSVRRGIRKALENKTELIYEGFKTTKKYNWDTIYNQTLELYNEVVKNGACKIAYCRR